MTKNPQVDEYLKRAQRWQNEVKELRRIILGCGLTEEYKWMHPCYTFEGNNVLIVQGFKEYCALLFVKGSLLKDPEGVLIQQTENVQAGRQIRFTSNSDIIKMEPILKDYIKEAIEIEKAGLKVEHKKTSDYKIPEEFQKKLDESPKLKQAFEALTPGRQHAYILYFSSAKQSQTRIARIEKYTPQILAGKGLND